MSGLQRHTADISQKMDENFWRVEHSLGQLAEDVVGLKKQRSVTERTYENFRKTQTTSCTGWRD